MCQEEQVVDKGQVFESRKQSSLKYEIKSSGLFILQLSTPLEQVVPGRAGSLSFTRELSGQAQFVIAGKVGPRGLWLLAD